MSERVGQVLRDLQGAVAVRHLYPADHPRVIESLARVAQGVRDATVAGEISVYAIDQRVVFDGQPLSSGDALSRGLFAWLAARGFHRLTLRPGATPAELASFVEALAAISRGADGAVELGSSPRIRLSAVDTGDEGRGESGGEGRSSLVLPDAGSALGRLWRGVMDHRTLEFDALDMTVMALVGAIERNGGAMLPLAELRNHDDYTVAHIVNVALLTIALAEAVGFRPAVLRDIGIAAILHDIGKLKVPVEVLNAPGHLSDQQRELVRRHPEDGARMLMSTPGVPELAVAVAFEHHIHHDGGGYPTVPRGWQVNVASEMTHIADVFDALRSHRPYRAGLPLDRVAQIMLGDAGTVFSPALLQTFFETIAPRAPAPSRPLEAVTLAG